MDFRFDPPLGTCVGIISQSIGGRKLCAPTVTDFVHNVGANCVRPKGTLSKRKSLSSIIGEIDGSSSFCVEGRRIGIIWVHLNLVEISIGHFGRTQFDKLTDHDAPLPLV